MIMASPSLTLLLIAALTIGIFVLDLVTPPGWTDGFLYLIPLILLSRSPQHHRLVGFASLCCGLIILGWLFSPPGGATGPVTYNRSMGLALLGGTALFLRHRKQVEETLQEARDELEERVQERTESLVQANQTLRVQVTERLKVEGVLRESEERFRLIMEHANDAIFFRDLHGVVQWASHGATVLTGRTLNELLGHSITAILAPGSAAVAEARLAAVRRGESVPPMVETEILHPDGSSVWVELNATSVTDAQGLAGRLIVARDITERKRAEESLKLFRVLLDQVRDSIEVIDPQTGRFMDGNEKAWSNLGYTRNELLSLTVLDIDPHVTKTVFASNMQRLRETERTLLLDSIHLRKDGTTFPVEVSAQLVQYDKEKEYVVAIVRDITERRRAEAALRESEERFRVFMDNSSIVAWIKDAQGRYVYINHPFELRHQRTFEEIEGKTDFDFRLEETAKQFQINDQYVLSSGKTLETFESAKLPDAGPHWFVHKFLIEGASGQRFVGGIGIDITERKQAEKVLRENEQRLSQLLESRERISRDLHDNIIQMIYAIGLGVEECQRLIKKDPATAFEVAGNAITGLNAVIRDVRQYIVGLEPKILSGRQLRTELAELVRTMEAPHLLRFRLSVDPAAAASLPPEKATHALYVVREAMSNSLRHSHAKTGGISIRLLKGNVHIEVKDDGAGFDMHRKGKHGKGLRNMMARAKEIGARFEVVSQLGQGTRVILDIPLASENA